MKLITRIQSGDPFSTEKKSLRTVKSPSVVMQDHSGEMQNRHRQEHIRNTSLGQLLVTRQLKLQAAAGEERASSAVQFTSGLFGIGRLTQQADLTGKVARAA